MANKVVNVKEIVIERATYAARAVHATWPFSDGATNNSHTEKFEYMWNYYVPGSGNKSSTDTKKKENKGVIVPLPGNANASSTNVGRWHDAGSGGSVDALAFTKRGSKLWYVTEDYTPPEYATKVRFKVQPVSKTKEENNNSKTYYTGKYCSWAPNQDGWVINKNTLPKCGTEAFELELIKEGSNTGKIRATCVVGNDYKTYKNYISGYEITWYLYDGIGWGDGTTSTIDKTQITNEIKYGGKTGLTGFVASFADYQEDTVQIKAVVKPVSITEGIFVPDTREDMLNFAKRSVRQVNSLIVRLAPGTDRGVQAFWKLKYTTFLDHFEYQWQYAVRTLLKSSTAWTPGDSGDVAVDQKATDKQWMTSYTIPENSSKVRVRVRPVSTTAGMKYDDTWSDWVEFEFDVPEREISGDVTLSIMPRTDRTVVAVWSLKGIDGWTKSDTKNLDSFEYEWRYKVKGSTLWFPGSNGSLKATQTSDAHTDESTLWVTTYEAPENVKYVEFRLRPVANNENAFVGSWSSFYQYTFEVEKTYVPTGLIDIDVYSQENRSLYASWYFVESAFEFSSTKRYAGGDLCLYDDKVWICTSGSYFMGEFNPAYWTELPESVYKAQSHPNTENFDYEWEYYVHNAWFAGDSGTAPVYDNRASTSVYSIPNEASKVRVRVRPNPKYEINYSGAWSKRKVYEFTVPSKKIDDGSLKIRLMSGTDRTMLVSWTMNNDGLTDVGSFNIEWRYIRRHIEGPGPNEYVDAILDGGSGSSTPNARYFTFDAPEDAIEVQVRVVPVPTAENLFEGKWSKYADGKYSFKIEPREVENIQVDLQKGSERTVYAIWEMEFDGDVASYSYEWRYMVSGSLGDIWYDGSSGTATIESPVCTYDAPAISDTVEVRVRPEPLHTSDFVPTWSEYVIYQVPENTDPEVPDVPEVTVSGFNLTARVDNYDGNAVDIEFDIVDETTHWNTGISPIELNRATYTTTIAAGKTYRARARALNSEGTASDWSNYSSDVTSYPAPLPVDPTCAALSSTSVELNWEAVAGADSYEIEYTTKKRYFDAAPSQVQSITIENGTRGEVTGLETGQEYFFRVRTKNSQGESEWSNIVSAIVGTIPGPPTTWSSTTTATVDRDIYLYWVHNSEDNSLEQLAELEIIINGVSQTQIIENESEDPEHTSEFLLPANSFNAGAVIQWRVRTKGVMDEYGDWSTQRFVYVYTPPALQVILSDGTTWNNADFVENESNVYEYTNSPAALNEGYLTSFPLLVYLDAYPKSQVPITYSITITANESYDGFNDTGSTVPIVAGQTVYQRVISTDKNKFMTVINAGDVNFENGVSYTLTATVAMDSGLSAEAIYRFGVQWGDEDFYLDAEVAIDRNILAAYITPYCMNENFQIRNDVTLGVYRRDFDGGFTEIAKDLVNTERITVTDPHPSLDFARYRITATSIATGRVYFLDLAGVEIGETAIIIQWDERWSNYDSYGEGALVDQPWKGSIVKLPYNVDISESNTVDVEMIEYIGRRHPVSYYGTQVGQEGNWNSDIPATDKDTVYALRRLAVWTGNAYVREPSGSGYWAQVAVSFNRNHNETVIPVSINVKRVEGGM